MSTFAAHVKRGKTLVEREAKGIRDVAALRFQLGDEILAVRAEAEYGDSSVEKYAKEIGISLEVAKQMAWTAEAFPAKGYRGNQSSREFNASYTVFRELAGRDDRFQVIAKMRKRKPEGRYWTADDIRAELGKELKRQPMRTAREMVAELPTEEQARIVQSLAQERPEVIAEAMEDKRTRIVATGAAEQVLRRKHEEVTAEREADPAERKLRQGDDATSAASAIGNAYGWLRDCLDYLSKAGELDESTRLSMVRLAGSCHELSGTILEYVQTGGGDLDAELEKIMGEA